MILQYAGIGSRETPQEILEVFVYLGEELAKRGFILRSGAACGADTAFETGCDKALGEKEIYLPWQGFNGRGDCGDYIFHECDDIEKATEIARKYHPYWNNLTKGGKALQTRNSFQILGQDLESPSLFVICYTKDGKGEGGTGQALRIAKDYGIKICDFGKFPKEQAFQVAKKVLNSLTPEYVSELESSIHFPETEREIVER